MRLIKKALAIILVAVQVFSMLPASIYAESIGAVIDLSDTSPPSSGTGWTYSSSTYTITGDVTVTMPPEIAQVTNRRIVISGGTEPNPCRVTLLDVNMSYSANAPIVLNTGAHAVLILDGTNTITSTGANFAGIQTTGAFLTIWEAAQWAAQ